LVLNADGSFTYTPTANYAGTDSFTYKANDGLTDSNIATVNLKVNGPPVAVGDSYRTDKNTPLIVSAPGVLGNDTDPNGDPLTAIKVSNPTNGAVTLNANGSFTYTPSGSFVGWASFTYKVYDGSLYSTVVKVWIQVNGSPVAVNDSYKTNINTPLTIPVKGVLSNDSDPNGDTLTAVKVTDPSHGTVTLNSNGSFTYTPTANYTGSDSFTYKANDGLADSNIVTVNISVNALTALLANYPNPFNPETWIPFSLSNDAKVEIMIYTSNGQLVRSLDLGYKSAGGYIDRDKSAYWDGKNESGEYVSSGIYFYTIKASNFVATRKMVMKK
jgi:large repetitive protein